jgi:hypothetical protein
MTPFLVAPCESRVPLPGTARGSMLARSWFSRQSVVSAGVEAVVAAELAGSDGGELDGGELDGGELDGGELDEQAASTPMPTVIRIVAVTIFFKVLPLD